MFGIPTPSCRRLLVPLLAGALVVAGCSDDDDNGGTPGPGPSGSTTFTGTLAGQTQSGSLSLTVNIAAGGLRVTPANHPTRVLATVNVTGTIEITGLAPISVAGTYDTDANTLTATGGGYTLTGTRVGTRLSGTWTGPAGASGTWSAQYGAAATDTVRVFCGTFTSTSGGDDGFFNLVTSGTLVSGVAVASGGGTQLALVGNLVELGVVDSVYVAPSAFPDSVIASGVVNVTLGTASGEFDFGTNSGVWVGERCD